MTRTPSKEESQEMLKWLNRNRHHLKAYDRQFVAYNANGIISHDRDLQQVLQIAEASGELFLIYLVPGFTESMVILPIQFRSVSRHQWQPEYPVLLKHKDSAIDATIISNK